MIVISVILTGSSGADFSPEVLSLTLAAAILSTTSIPSITWPKTV